VLRCAEAEERAAAVSADFARALCSYSILQEEEEKGRVAQREGRAREGGKAETEGGMERGRE
jgi:hypothetical protein